LCDGNFQKEIFMSSRYDTYPQTAHQS